MKEAVLLSWEGSVGTCADGVSVMLGSSCLVQPEAGDRVLIADLTTGAKQNEGCGVIIAILERQQDTAEIKLAARGDVYINAPEINIRTTKLQSNSNELLSHAVNRHIIEDARTVNAKVRVAEVGYDHRIAGGFEDSVRGALWQRFGLWLSNTVSEARLKASSFIYDKYSK